jgi:hypothetical protein
MGRTMKVLVPYKFLTTPSIVTLKNTQSNSVRQNCFSIKGKGKGHAHNRPQGPKGVPGRLRPRIFLTFGTTRVVGRHPHAPAAFIPGGESTPGHMVPSVATEKIPSMTPPGIDPETVRLVAQCLNHYATPGPFSIIGLK